METIDSRLKRIEQRLSSIEKYIAENFNPSKNKDISLTLGRVSEKVEVAKEFRFEEPAPAPFDPNKPIPKPIFIPIDTAAFNNPRRLIITDDTVTTASAGLVLSVALFFIGRTLMDSSAVNPTEQVSLAAALSIAFIVMGFIFESAFGVYAKYFPIVGTVLLNVSIYGATSHYKLIPINVGLVAILANSIMSIFLFTKFKIQIYQVLSVIGAYVVPLYITAGTGYDLISFYYLLVSIMFMVAALWLDLSLLVSFGAFVSLGVCAISEYIDSDTMNQVMFTLGHFIIFSSAYILKTVKSEKEIDSLYSYSYFIFAVLFYLIEFYYINSFRPTWSGLFTGLITLLLFIFFLIIEMFVKDEKHRTTTLLLLSTGTGALAHTVFYLFVPGRFRSISLIIASVLALKLFERLDEKKWKLYISIVTYFILALIGWNYFEVIISQFSAKNYLPLTSGFVYVSAISYLTFYEKKFSHLEINPFFGIGFIHAMVLVSIYNLTKNLSTMVWGGAVVAYLIVILASYSHLHAKSQRII